MPDYYDIDGTPIHDTLEWARLFESRRKDGSFRVGEANLPNGIRISTVWLGLDHSFGGLYGDSPPLIFESMVFGLPHTETVFGRQMEVRDDLEMDRYSTWHEAKAGHDALVAKWTVYDALETAYNKTPNHKE